jgi:multidrug resistance efflux pump
VLIILTIYLVLVWFIFSKLKLIKWGWLSGTATALVGAFILAVFLAMFNSLTPSGGFVVGSRVIEVAPNVSGEVVEIPVRVNVPVKAGTILFRIDPVPFQYKVDQLEASLAGAKQQVLQLKASYQQASANVEGLTKQLAYHSQRLADYEQMVSQGAQAEFRLQDTQIQRETVQFQLQAAKAAQLSAKLAMDSEIGGVNTTVAQFEAQLAHAKWELAQTTIRASADGYVTAMALSVGDKAMQGRAVTSFIVAHDITIVGMFSPNGFQTVKPGASVKLVFDDDPGRIYHATVAGIPQGVGEGQIAVSGTLARVGSIGGANSYPAVITIPKDIDAGRLKLGMPGKAWVFADNAGVIGLIMSVLVWISSYAAYL